MDKAGELLHMVSNLRYSVNALTGPLEKMADKLNSSSPLTSEEQEYLADCVQYILAVDYYTKNVKSRLTGILRANKLFLLR